jgi:hypothetical protein
MKRLKLFLLFYIGTLYIYSGNAQTKGFFNIQKIDDKWHIVDFDGNIFHMRGCNHYGNGDFMPWNINERYGSKHEWRKSVRDNHVRYGFTYLPPSIGPSGIDPVTLGEKQNLRSNLVTRTPEWTANDFMELNYPFTPFLEVPGQNVIGNQNKIPDVFSDEFINMVDQKCREFVSPLKDNKNLIGYHFTHNPPWNINALGAEIWINSIIKPNSAALKEWIKLMQQIYGTTERWRETYGIPVKDWSEIEKIDNPLRGYVNGEKLRRDKEAFLKRICEQWYKVYHDAIRKYDKNHLILGDRNTLHLQVPPSPWAFSIMSKYIDVLSVNVMGPPNTILSVLEAATRNWDGPILLSDTGAGIYCCEPPKSAYQTANINEFEIVYSGLIQLSIEHPQIVGFGWCGYYDIPQPIGRSGLFDVKNDEPVVEIIDIVQKWNSIIEAKINSLNKIK